MRATKEPAHTQAPRALQTARVRDVPIGRGGLYGNTIWIVPSMCLTKADSDFPVDCLEQVFGTLRV